MGLVNVARAKRGGAPALPEGTYRFWELEIIRADGDTTRVGTLEFLLATSANGAQVASGGTATATTSDAASSPNNAFDGNTTTSGWYSAGTPALSRDNPHRLRYDFGAGNEKKIVEVGIGSWPFNSSLTRSIRVAKVRASNDGVTWVEVKTLPNLTGWTYQQLRRFSVFPPDNIVARTGGIVASGNTSGKTIGKLLTPASDVTLRGVRLRLPSNTSAPDTADVFCRVYSAAGALLSSDTAGDYLLSREVDALLNTPLVLTGGTPYKVCVYSPFDLQGQAHSGGASAWAGFTADGALLSATSDANPTTSTAGKSPDFDLILV
jgi:hypothetical protein